MAPKDRMAAPISAGNQELATRTWTTPALIVLVGVSGAGKSTWATRHFAPETVLSSDAVRAELTGDPADQSANDEVFARLEQMARVRLAARHLTVIDATNVRPADRARWIDLANRAHLPVYAVVFSPEAAQCERQAAARTSRPVSAEIVREQWALFSEAGLHARAGAHDTLKSEGFTDSAWSDTPATLEPPQWQPLACDQRGERGPFDIIGDVHGCFDELRALLSKLGAEIEPDKSFAGYRMTAPPAGRRLVYVGDLVDRGPASAQVVAFVRQSVADGFALCVKGNHDLKAARWFAGRDVKTSHGLAATIASYTSASSAEKSAAHTFLANLPTHLWLDEGRLAVAHAGIFPPMLGGSSGAERSMCLFGDTSGEKDEYGLPIRRNWALEHDGSVKVVYGHTPLYEPQIVHNTVCIDTGCCFGLRLSAYRYPEAEVVSVPANAQYYSPPRPIPGAPDPR